MVPRDHFYRHLEAKLNLEFVRDLVQERYAAGGRPSIDPVVFFKLQLIMFFEGIRSERQLIEVARLNLAHRWYLGYHVDERLPDHSSLTRIRTRLGVEVFQRFFEQIVELCQAAGLVWGKELIFDATQVRANAAVDSLLPRFYLRAKSHVETLFASDADEAAPPQDHAAQPDEAANPSAGTPVCSTPAPNALPWRGTPDRAAELAATNQAAWRLLEQYRLDPERGAIHRYQRLSALGVSTTDPDATVMRMKGGGPTILGYHDHYVVDGGKARIILAALVTPADVMENTPMLDLLWRVRFRWKLWPKRAIGDTTYGTAENIRTLEEAGIRAYVPLPDWDQRTPYYPASRFSYDAERDEYRCPQGQPLRRLGADTPAELVRYRAEAATCNACPVKAECTASPHGRVVARSFHAAYFEQVRAYHQTPAYHKALRKRAVWVEPLFGEAKQWHGLRWFRLWGLPKVNLEALLVAAGQNLKRWLATTGWGRRDLPCGSLALAADLLPRRFAACCSPSTGAAFCTFPVSRCPTWSFQPKTGPFSTGCRAIVHSHRVPCTITPARTAPVSSLERADLHRQIDTLPAERLDVVERSPEVLGGLPVFRGTRVPARALLDYLAAGDSLETFLDDFPSVRREQAIALLELTRELMPS